MTSREKDFFNMCYDCLYYGYTKRFIFDTYTDIIKEIGKEKALKIYEKVFEKITSE